MKKKGGGGKKEKMMLFCQWSRGGEEKKAKITSGNGSQEGRKKKRKKEKKLVWPWGVRRKHKGSVKKESVPSCRQGGEEKRKQLDKGKKKKGGGGSWPGVTVGTKRPLVSHCPLESDPRRLSRWRKKRKGGKKGGASQGQPLDLVGKEEKREGPSPIVSQRGGKESVSAPALKKRKREG